MHSCGSLLGRACDSGALERNYICFAPVSALGTHQEGNWCKSCPLWITWSASKKSLNPAYMKCFISPPLPKNWVCYYRYAAWVRTLRVSIGSTRFDKETDPTVLADASVIAYSFDLPLIPQAMSLRVTASGAQAVKSAFCLLRPSIRRLASQFRIQLATVPLCWLQQHRAIVHFLRTSASPQEMTYRMDSHF